MARPRRRPLFFLGGQRDFQFRTGNYFLLDKQITQPDFLGGGA